MSLHFTKNSGNPIKIVAKSTNQDTYVIIWLLC